MDGDQTDQERDIAENTEAEMPIGDTDDMAADGLVAATDPNDDSLTYSLGGTDAASFSIVRSTGRLQTKAALNWEEQDTYMVTVMATDPSGLSATVNVTIKITDMPEPPVIMRAPDANVAPEFASATTSRTVAENTAAGEDIGTPVRATDANGDTLTYRLSGTGRRFLRHRHGHGPADDPDGPGLRDQGQLLRHGDCQRLRRSQ